MTTSPTTDIQPELLPCPFCRGEARDYKVRGLRGWIVDCSGCGASVHESDPQRVRLHWNTRLTSTTPTLGDMVARESFANAVWDALKADTSDLRKQQRIVRALDALSAAPASPIPTSVNGADRERIARALCVSSGDDPDREGPWAEWWHESAYARDADAVIAVLPTSVNGAGERDDEYDDALYDYAGAPRPTALSPALDNTAVEGLREAIRREIINTPETADFMAGVPLEAVHQRERWGAEHDAGKGPLDWFWLIGYLAQKAADAAMRGDAEKAKHHTISTAAALANWHAALTGADTSMRPGIEPPVALTAETEKAR